MHLTATASISGVLTWHVSCCKLIPSADEYQSKIVRKNWTVYCEIQQRPYSESMMS